MEGFFRTISGTSQPWGEGLIREGVKRSFQSWGWEYGGAPWMAFQLAAIDEFQLPFYEGLTGRRSYQQGVRLYGDPAYAHGARKLLRHQHEASTRALREAGVD
jgi:hypothetical protein